MPGSEETLTADHTSHGRCPAGEPGLLHAICLIRSLLICLILMNSDAQVPTELCKGPISRPDLDKTIAMAKALPSASPEPGLALNLKAKVKGSPITGWGLPGLLCL